MVVAAIQVRCVHVHHNCMLVCMHVPVKITRSLVSFHFVPCVCVSVRERERERERVPHRKGREGLGECVRKNRKERGNYRNEERKCIQ